MIASAFQFLIIKYKLEHERYQDAFLDAAITALLIYMFKGTFQGMTAAVGSSVIVSAWLLYFPPTFLNRLLKPK